MLLNYLIKYISLTLMTLVAIMTSGGLSQDFAGSGQNRVTATNQVRAGSSHNAVRNITVAKFNQ